MIWHDRPMASPGELDAEQELELRLSAQARAGAAWALSALVARYQPPVVRYLVRLTGSRQTSYALAEQVFVRMGRRLRGPQGGRQLRLWLLRAATDAGLDALRAPAAKPRGRLLAGARPAALLPAVMTEPRASRILTALGVKAQTREAEHETATGEFVWQPDTAADALAESPIAPDGSLTPEALRLRLTRAVLAELPYADAQCLALHLVAGLNQSDVAQALGLADVLVRRRIVQGLEFFAVRYDATLDRLGLHEEDMAAPTEEPTIVDGRDEVLDAVPATVAAMDGTVAATASETSSVIESDAEAVVASALAEQGAASGEPETVSQPMLALPPAEEAGADVATATADAQPPMDAVPAAARASEPAVAALDHAPAQADEPVEAEAVAEATAGIAADADALTLAELALPPTAEAQDADTLGGMHAGETELAGVQRAPVTWRIVDLQPAVPREVELLGALASGGDAHASGREEAQGATAIAQALAQAPRVETETAVLEDDPDEAEPYGSEPDEDHAAPPGDLAEAPVPAPVIVAARVTHPLLMLRAPATRPLPLALRGDSAESERDILPALNAPRGNQPEPAHGKTEEPPAVSPTPTTERSRRAVRTKRVLSADGEAEDPSGEALWPLA